jgi:hypothetical protein
MEARPDSRKYYSVKELCKLFPGRRGHGISRATAMRWMFHGVDGVRLESAKIGGARYVTPEAVDCFIAALNNAPAIRRADRDHEAERVARELKLAGF